ncbi:hypothetical protein EDF59_105323 [Novosphingobium sp. ST904]|nr:hypothetical protein EDF59_105323 [Novosphingobium sp. ST904]
MTLKAYLDATGEKQVDFAERVRTTPATVSRLCKRSLRPALDLAHRIETATNGRVPTETWVEGIIENEVQVHTDVNAATQQVGSTGQTKDLSGVEGRAA